jgi:hypothetical protein
LRSTNTIESMIEICRDHAANVKRWQDGQMVLRWIAAAGMGEARRQFRRVNGHLYLPALRVALDQTMLAMSHRPRRMPPDHPPGPPPEVLRDAEHPPSSSVFGGWRAWKSIGQAFLLGQHPHPPERSAWPPLGRGADSTTPVTPRG